jgi:hypothetical protein
VPDERKATLADDEILTKGRAVPHATADDDGTDSDDADDTDAGDADGDDA